MRLAPFTLPLALLAACAGAPPAPSAHAPRAPVAAVASSAAPFDAGADADGAIPPPMAPASALADGIVFEEAAAIRAIAQDERYLFLGTSAGVVARSKSDATRRPLSGELSFTRDRLVVAGADLYWPAYGGIQRVAKSGPPEVKPFAGNGMDVDDLTCDGVDLYWSTGFVARTGAEVESQLFRGSPASGAVETLWKGLGSVLVGAYDADSIYFRVTPVKGPTRWLTLRKHDRTVAPWSLALDKKNAITSMLAVHEGRALVAVLSVAEMVVHTKVEPGALMPSLTVERTGYLLYAADARGQRPVLLAGEMCPLDPPPTSLGRAPRNLRVAGAWIYWACQFPATIHRMPVGGGAVETVVTVTGAFVDYVVDGPKLYWAEVGERSVVRVKTLAP